MKLIKFIPIIGIVLSSYANAGYNSLTIHSRANCVNNESITWHKGHTYNLLTVSDHLKFGKRQHSLATGWEVTWRSANVHWGEPGGEPYWYVQAGHYMKVGYQDYRIGFTTASDCSIYDGWWD